MNTLQYKKLAIAFLSVGAVAVWAPMLRSSEREVRHGGGVASDEGTGGASRIERSAPAPEPESAAGDPGVSAGGERERDLAAMLSFLPTGSPSSLEEAAMAWSRESSGPTTPAFVTEERVPTVRPEAETRRARLQDEESVARYLADRPLTGILHHPSGSLALLGGQVVHEGDVLVQGVLTVEAIAPSHVTLAYRGDRVRLSLPGLRAAPPAVIEPAEPAPQTDLRPDAAPVEAPVEEPGETPGAAPGPAPASKPEGAGAPTGDEDSR